MKYIIEIPDDVQYILLNGKADNKYYTAVRPIAELEELNSDYINEHYGELQDDAYKRGYEEGHNVGIKDGMCDAWEAARKIVVDTDNGGIALGTLGEIFGTQAYSCIMRDNTAQEAIDKIKAYEEKQKADDEIKVGDEVVMRGLIPGNTFLVTKVTESSVYGISDDGSWNFFSKDSATKTGKHYDIQSILEAMRK